MFDPRSSRPLLRASAAAMLLLAGCRTSPPPSRLDRVPAPPAAAPAELLRLGPNDVIRARVHGHPELSTPESVTLTGTRVDPEGLLSLPLVGALPVGGLTLTEARERIRTAYASFMKDPAVEVSVVEYAARRFYLYGEVKAPGPYTIDRPMSAYQALTFGGGFERNADRKRVVLLRETADGVDVHLIDGERPDESGLVAILPDDFLFVRRTGAGKFSEEILPVLTGISSSLSSLTTLILIEDRLDDQ